MSLIALEIGLFCFFFFFKSRNRNTKRYIRFIHNSTTWRYWLSDFRVNLCLPFDPASGALLLQPWLLASSPSSNSPTIQDFDSRDHCQTHTAQHKPVQPSAQDVPRSFVCKSFGPVGRAGVQVLALHWIYTPTWRVVLAIWGLPSDAGTEYISPFV